MEGSLSGYYRAIRILLVIKGLQTGKQRTVHGTTLRIFRHSSYEVDEVCRAQLEFQDNEFWVVEESLTLVCRKEERQLLVKWIGFEDEGPGQKISPKLVKMLQFLCRDFYRMWN